jgi:predicted nucleotidyltransferase
MNPMGEALDRMVARIKAEESELRRRGVCHLSLFGSVVRGEDREDSDIDIAVDIEAGRSFSLIRLEETRLLLEDLLGRPVDLGETETFRPAVRAAFERDHRRVF